MQNIWTNKENTLCFTHFFHVMDQCHLAQLSTLLQFVSIYYDSDQTDKIHCSRQFMLWDFVMINNLLQV